MEGLRVGIFLGAAPVQHRRQIRPAAEPRLGGDHEAGIHVHRRHVRIAQVRDQRNARGPEPGIVRCARDLGAELGCEFAVHGGTVHADFLEQSAAHDRHHAAAAGLAGVVGAVPGRAHEAAGVALIERGRCIVFQPLEGRANVVAQCLEPAPRPRLAILDQRHVHPEFPTLLSVIASEAKQSIVPRKDWIASSLTLLAMTVVNT